MSRTRVVIPETSSIVAPTEEEEEEILGVDFAAAVRRNLKLGNNPKPRMTISIEDPYLNKLFGDGSYTLRSGEIAEIRGVGSSGKTSLMADLAARLLRAGVVVHWVDFERSWNDVWMLTRGVPRSAVSLYECYPSEEDPADYIPSAEDILSQVAQGLKMAHSMYPKKFQAVFVDSLAAMITREELDQWEDRNMKTDLSTTKLVGKMLKWANWVYPVYNACLICINQTRINPMAMFKSPVYSATGGESIGFFPSVRIDMHREAKRYVNKQGEEMGIKGYAHSFKQKMGGGEGFKAAYRLPFSKGPVEWFDYKK